ncbi:MAG: helix-turn-helix transcriptional regulator [Phycisphaerae bacterium]|jgi:transcriptional regulator with XRE-family HTH domain
MVMHLGKEIAVRRKAKKLSLRQAAEIVGMSHQAVNNAEHGLTSFESALKIAKALGAPKDKLIDLAKQDAEDLARNT